MFSCFGLLAVFSWKENLLAAVGKSIITILTISLPFQQVMYLPCSSVGWSLQTEFVYYFTVCLDIIDFNHAYIFGCCRAWVFFQCGCNWCLKVTCESPPSWVSLLFESLHNYLTCNFVEWGGMLLKSWYFKE